MQALAGGGPPHPPTRGRAPDRRQLLPPAAAAVLACHERAVRAAVAAAAAALAADATAAATAAPERPPHRGRAGGPANRQRQLQLQERLQACCHWRQLLPLVPAATAQRDGGALVAVAARALQLQPPTAVGADHHGQQPQPPGDGFDEPSAAATAAAGCGSDRARREAQSHRQLLVHLLGLLGARLAAATAAPAAAPPPAQLCQLLTQLSDAGGPVPPGWGEQLAHYLRALCRERGTRRTPGEVAAVLSGLGRLRPPGLEVPPGVQKRLLRHVVSEQRPGAPAAEVARALWAAGRLRWTPNSSWLQQAAAALLAQAKGCTASELAMGLWGLASLGCDADTLCGLGANLEPGRTQQGRGGEPWRQQQQQPQQQQQQLLLQRPVAAASEQLLQAVSDRADDFDAHELVAVLWALAAAPLQPQRPLVRQLLRRCAQPGALQQYADVDLACILWSAARMQRRLQPAPAQPRRAAAPAAAGSPARRRWRAQQQQQQLEAERREAAEGALLAPVDAAQQLLDAMLLGLPACRARFLASVLLSLATLRLRPPAAWLGRVLGHLRFAMPSVHPSSLALLAWAVAGLDYRPSAAWLRALYSATQRHLASGALTARDLGLLAGAAQRLSYFADRPSPMQKPPAAWLDAFSAAVAATLPALPPRSLAVVGGAVLRFSSLAGEAWRGPGGAWWAAYASATRSQLAAASARDLAAFGRAMSSRQRASCGPPPPGWAAALAEASRPWLRLAGGGGCAQASPASPAEASGRDLVELGRALALLGELPDGHWLRDWELSVEASGAQLTARMGATFRWARSRFSALAAERQPLEQQPLEQQQQQPAGAWEEEEEQLVAYRSWRAWPGGSAEGAAGTTCSDTYDDSGDDSDEWLAVAGEPERSVASGASGASLLAADWTPLASSDGPQLAAELHERWERQQESDGTLKQQLELRLLELGMEGPPHGEHGTADDGGGGESGGGGCHAGGTDAAAAGGRAA